MGKFGGGDGIYTQEFKCAICGKKGYKNGRWLYRRSVNQKNIYFCGYNCMRKFDKAKEEEKAVEAAKREERRKISAEVQREKAKLRNKRSRERRKLGDDKEGTAEN